VVGTLSLGVNRQQDEESSMTVTPSHVVNSDYRSIDEDNYSSSYPTPTYEWSRPEVDILPAQVQQVEIFSFTPATEKAARDKINLWLFKNRSEFHNIVWEAPVVSPKDGTITIVVHYEIDAPLPSEEPELPETKEGQQQGGDSGDLLIPEVPKSTPASLRSSRPVKL
jgi:hypothetical protein